MRYRRSGAALQREYAAGIQGVTRMYVALWQKERDHNVRAALLDILLLRGQLDSQNNGERALAVCQIRPERI